MLKDKIHEIFFIVFAIINLIIFVYIKYYLKDDCECANEKVFGLIQPLDFIMVFALIGVFIGIINIFTKLNQGFSSLPLIGTFFNVGIIFLSLIQAYMVVVFLKKINNQKCIEIKKCKSKTLKTISKIIIEFGLFVYIISFIIGIMLVWI